MKEIIINTEFIKLSSFLKLTGTVSTGGSAKNVITDGEVLVNGQVCNQRGKKLYKDDVVTFKEVDYVVKVR